MPPSATELGPARLRLLATAAKREALALAFEWGTPLARIPPVVAEAFQSRLGEAACDAIRGWERDLNELSNCLVRLYNVSEAAADEEEAIARAMAGGFPPPTRYQDVASAFVAWERRSRQHRPFTPPSGGNAGGFVAVDPGRVRQAAQGLLDARDEFHASYQRLTGPFRDVGLEAPDELRWVVEDCERLAQELRGRADAFEAAEAQVRHAAATALAGGFSGLMAPMAATTSVSKAEAGRNLRRRAGADAKRLMEELRPGGVFDLTDFEKGRKLAAEAELASKEGPRYAAAFLRALGPGNLRWLIEHGQLDPCVLGALVARGSQAGIGADFLTKTLGTDRFDAPRRAALLSACSRPTAMFHPVWVERMTVTLLTGRDPPGKGDPRRWYREAAANLLGTHPAGAIWFINRHQQLACGALFSHDDKGGRAAQAAVDDMLLNPPDGMEKQAEDALERVVTCAASNEFSAEGKRALACLLARPETLQSVTLQIVTGLDAEPARERGFHVASDRLKTVLSALMVDTESRRTLLDAANRMAAEKLRRALAAPDASARRAALDEAGAVFGALASRSYSLEAALDARGLAADTARNLVGSVGGVVLNVAKAHPVVSLAVESGSAILFDIGEASAEQRQLEAELHAELDAAEKRDRLKADLTQNLEHLAYVSVLGDPEERAALGLRLSPADLPAELPADLNLSVTNREEWARDIFDEKGQLVVPQPSDPGRWNSFLAWTKTVNPELRNRVSALTDPMFGAFDRAGRE
jgi:hypothetical protein